MATPTLTPAGWYTDPGKRHEYRYWDGTGWTGQVADHGVLATDLTDFGPGDHAAETTARIPVQAAAQAATPAPAAPAPTTPAPAAPAPAAAAPASPRPAAPPPGATAPPGPPRRHGPAAPRNTRTLVIAAIASLAVLGLVAALLVWSPWSGGSIAAPGGVSAQAASPTSVVLTWSPPTGDLSVDSYVVERDGDEIGSVPGTATSYTDDGLTPGGSYRYGVAAVSGDSRSEVTSAAEVITPAPAPSNLAAVGRAVDAVTLRWTAPAAEQLPDRYAVVRDGSTLGFVPGTETSYVDAGLTPGSEHTYTVEAVWGDVHSVASEPLTVSTLTPTTGSARLTGSWPVDMTVVTSTGGLDSGTALSSTWQFRPLCADGACDVILTGDIGGGGYIPHDFRVHLNRSGNVYTGSTKAHITECGGNDVINTVTIRITVRKGGMDAGTWSATRWGGRMTVASPYTPAGGTLYCPAQSWTASVSPQG